MPGGQSLVLALRGGRLRRRAAGEHAAARCRPPRRARERDWRADAGEWRRAADAAELAERRRLAALAVAERSRTVAGALRRALPRAPHLPRGRSSGCWRSTSAPATPRAAPASRGAELAAVVANVERLAYERRLTAGRFTAVFLVLRRNQEFWSALGPAAGRLPHQLRARPRGVPVLPGPGAAAPAAGELGPRQRASPTPACAPACATAAAARARRCARRWTAWSSSAPGATASSPGSRTSPSAAARRRG